jgi:outer membrane protein assembly factor BamD
MRPVLFLLGLALLLASCSEFNKAQKSTDIQYKFQTAEKYYLAEEYDRAVPLLEELVSLTRGTELSEKVYYYHAKSMFGMKDYILANYYLGNFTKTFPNSAYAEECAFLSAYCFYKNSPEFELDQVDTRSAINDLQLFLIRYPHSNLKDSCNALIDMLRGKLELKDFNNARQYYKLQKYHAASVAFRGFLQDWPNSEYREEALWTILRADQHLAENSVESKRKERLQDAIRSFHNFADAFPESPDLREAERIHEQLKAELESLNEPANP